MSLEFEDPADLANDEVLFIESNFLSEREVVDGVQKGVKMKAAEDPCVHPRFADAGGKINPYHCSGGTEKVVGDFCGVPFRGCENEVGEGTLEMPERRAVNVMNDNGDTGPPGRET